MQGNLLRELGKIAGIAGIGFGVLLSIYQAVLAQKLIPAIGLTPEQAYDTINAVIILTFGIAGIGAISWLAGKATGPGSPVPSRTLYILAALMVVLVTAVVFLRTSKLGFGLHEPPKVMKICFGQGGGAHCHDGAYASLDCDAWYREGPTLARSLGEQYCAAIKGGTKWQMPSTVKTVQDNDGGRCGWHAYEVTCYP